jgi:hypothetical protein
MVMSLDGLNALRLSYFKGNSWAGNTKITLAFYFDERANQQQRDALRMIFKLKPANQQKSNYTFLVDRNNRD